MAGRLLTLANLQMARGVCVCVCMCKLLDPVSQTCVGFFFSVLQCASVYVCGLTYSQSTSMCAVCVYVSMYVYVCNVCVYVSVCVNV